MRWDVLQSAGAAMGGGHWVVGTAVGPCLAPTAPHPRRADVPQQAQHRGRTHHLQVEARTMCVRATGSYRAETTVSHQGLQKPKGAGSPDSVPF